jgi:hypothetical protein
MKKSTIQTLILAISVMALAGIWPITPALSKTKTAHSKHLRKHQVAHWNYGPGYARPAGRAWPAGGAWPGGGAWPAVQSPAPSGDVCPGIGRSFECKIWPPPMDQDPDRKGSGADAGG